jgi:hypothetical protein
MRTFWKVTKMDLSIDFECPECQKVQSQKVADLFPGRRQACLACGTPTELTASSLEEFQQRLRALFEGWEKRPQPSQKP